jgi:hypothetical protein
MTTFRKIAAALLTLATLGTSAPAFAGSHMIEAHSTSVIEFYACGEFILVAVGDQDTDLDFQLFGPRGRLLHADDDPTDVTMSIVNGGCGKFRLQVENLGDVYNELNVTVTRNSTDREA